MTVAALFQKIGRKKTEAASTAYGRYRTLLIDLVNGVELDSEAAEIVLNEYRKDQHQLETDVETMRQRLQWSKNIELREQAEIDARKYTSEIEKADQEFAVQRQRHAAIVGELRPKLHAAENAISQCSIGEQRLRQSCLDPGIFAAEKPLIEAKKELNRKRQDIAADLDVAQRRVAWAKAALAKAGKVGIKSILPDGKAKEQEQQITQLKENIKNLEVAVTNKQKQLRQVDIELAKCRKSLEEFNVQKLKP